MRPALRDPGDAVVHSDLKQGTVLRASTTGFRCCLLNDMQGDFAHCAWARKDGTPDRRYRRWSGSLPKDIWKIEGA